MSPDRFRAACGILWGRVGDPWGLGGAGVFLRVNDRNMRAFASGQKEVGPDFEGALLSELRRGLAGELSSPALDVVQAALTPAAATTS